LWTDTIEAHRNQVREAIIDATARLVAAHGLTSVTMSQVAEAAGIGRATLYKYFPDVEAILTTWHADQIAAHLQQLTALVDEAGDPGRQLDAVLHAYAQICAHRGRHGHELNALLHRGEGLANAQHELFGLFRDLIERAARAGLVRTDVSANELAVYCAHALTSASLLPSKAAVGRLVEVTAAGLRGTSEGPARSVR
jgi:AcrR family transcriptional regulator